MDAVLNDLRHAARRLAKSPGFTAVSVLTLALGIGAVTAIWSVVDAVLLEPLPFPSPERLVTVWSAAPDGNDHIPVSVPDFRDWRAMSRSFAALGAFANTTGAITIGGEPQMVEGAVVSAGMLEALGVAPVLGRGFTVEVEREHPDTNSGAGATVLPLAGEIVAGVRPALLVLLGAVGFVLLIACANLASLLLARAAAGRPEVAMRAALGASRPRLAFQLLAESLLLAAAGGAAGLLLASWGLKLLTRLGPADLPRLAEIAETGIDGRALAFTAALTLVTALLFGLGPALAASRTAPAPALREGGRRAAPGRSRLRSALVVAELALALVLLAGAGLLIRTFVHLLRTDPGFAPERVLTAEVSLPWASYGEPRQQNAFFDELLGRVEALPGVRAAGVVSALPMTGADRTTGFAIEGRPEPIAAERPLSSVRLASPRYFAAMGIPLLRGRALSEADRLEAPKVAVVNAAFARRFFPGEEVVGQRLAIGWSEEAPREIVGVVGDVRHVGLDTPAAPEVFLPYAQEPDVGVTVVVRAAGDPSGLAGTVRGAVRAVDPALPVANLRTLDEVLSASLARRRFNMQLLALFAAVALALAGVGTYGVVAHSVAMRTHEIGVRMALGAGRGRVLSDVVGRAMALAGAGLALGLAGALALTRTLSGLLYGVSASDPATFAAVALLLAAVALAASAIPGRRAARLDPVVALKGE